DGDDRLGDGVLLDVESECGDPFDEAAVSGASEGGGEGSEQRLPDGPEERSVRHGAPPSGTRWDGDHPVGSTREMPRSIRYKRSVWSVDFPGNHCLSARRVKKHRQALGELADLLDRPADRFRR